MVQKFLVGLLLAVVVFVGVGKVNIAFAQSSGAPSLADFGSGCVTDPASCHCKFVLRDATGGIAPMQGRVYDDNSENVPGFEAQNLAGSQLAVLFSTTTEVDGIEENCYMDQDTGDILRDNATPDFNCHSSGLDYTISAWMTGILELDPGEQNIIWLRGRKGWLESVDTHICGVKLVETPLDIATDYGICKTNLGTDTQAYRDCMTCFGAENGTEDGGIWTAVGCIDKNPKAMIGKIINISIGIAGGITLLMILASAFTLTISQGDVKKTSDAKERLTSAIIGLIFIIFSVTILQFIGEGVLKIPGFGG